MSDLPSTEHPVTTTCACGGVTVSLNAPPRSMFHCACRDCQKASGAGHLPLIMMREAEARIEGELTAHAVTAASGATTTRHFCPVCGSRIFGQTSRVKGYVMIPAGLFGADAGWYAPKSLIFARSLLHWDAIADSIERYDTYRG